MDVADLYQFTRTDHQRTVLDAVAEHGSYKLASESLGIHIGGASALVMRLRKEAARQGHAPGHFESGTAPGYRMGKVPSSAALGALWNAHGSGSPQRRARP
jgi:hypothetical protein